MKRWRTPVLVAIAAVVTLVVTLLTPTSAEGMATAGSIRIRPTNAIAGEPFQIRGKLPVGTRSVVLQRRSAGGWQAFKGQRTRSNGSFKFDVVAPASSTSYRVLAPRSGDLKAVVTPTGTLQAVAQEGTVDVPAAVETGDKAHVTLRFSPIRVGRPVSLERRDGEAWVSIASATQSSAGRADLSLPTATPGTVTLRAVTHSFRGARAFVTAERQVVIADKEPPPPIDTTAPAAPERPTATEGDTTVQLEWAPVGAEDLASYRVYRSASAEGPWTAVATTTGASTTYRVDSLVNRTRYFFAVASRDRSGNESGKSEAVMATPHHPDATPPPIPGGLTIGLADATAHLDWSPVVADDLAGYAVYSATAPDGP